MAYGLVWEQENSMLCKLVAPESGAFTTHMGDNRAIHVAACYVPDYLAHLQPPPPSIIMQPRHQRPHQLPFAMHGTSRHEASSIDCTPGGTSSSNQISSWLPLGGSEKWGTPYLPSNRF